MNTIKSSTLINAIQRHRSNNESSRFLFELTEASRGLILRATVLHGEEKVAVNQSYVLFEEMSNLDNVRENTLLGALQLAGTSVGDHSVNSHNEEGLPTKEIHTTSVDISHEEYSASRENPKIIPVTEVDKSKEFGVESDAIANADGANVPPEAGDTPASTDDDAEKKTPRRKRKESEAAPPSEVAEGSDATEAHEVVSEKSVETQEEAASEVEIHSAEETTTATAETIPEETKSTSAAEPTITIEDAYAVIMAAKPGEKVAKKIETSVLKEFIGKPLKEFAEEFPPLVHLLAGRAGTASSSLTEETERAIKVIASQIKGG